MAITPDNSTLIFAESHGKRLTAFDIATDGSLSNRRVWAELGNGIPDGICIDTDNAVWYADVPNKRCVRVREGGEVLQTVNADRGCFACMLGGPGRRTLFMVATEWRGRPRADGLRPILLLHGFRFVGLAFLVPGVVSLDLPDAFARPAAYGDLATVILALSALATLRNRLGTILVWVSGMRSSRMGSV